MPPLSVRSDNRTGSEGPKPHQGVVLARRIEEIARWQGGHVTRAQLYALGLSRRAVEHRMANGQLIRAHHGVYAVGHLPTSPIDQAHGALLAVGERSALAAETALALWRADRTWPHPFELISPRDIRLAHLTVHRSSTLLTRDIRRVQGLRVTSPARTALDLAPRFTSKELTGIVNDLRVVNKLKVHQLRDVVARNPRHPGAAHLRDLLGRQPGTANEIRARERVPETDQALPAPHTTYQRSRWRRGGRRLFPGPRADRGARWRPCAR